MAWQPSPLMRGFEQGADGEDAAWNDLAPEGARGPLKLDPQAQALAQQFYAIRDGLAAGGEQRPIWNPNNPVGTETLQSAGMPQPTTYAGTVGAFIDPATGRLTTQGVARLNDNPALGFDTGGLGMIKAFHGSPHLFAPTERNPLGEFDATKIGTGEGAQAYGVGAAYLGEAEHVARQYRENLSNPALFVDGKKVGEIGALGTDPVANAAHALATTPTPYAAREYIQQSMDRAADGNYGLGQSAGKAVLKAIDDMAGSKVEIRPGGHMYEVNVHADPEHFLHWDKPLSEQHPKVQEALAKIDPDFYHPKSNEYDAAEHGQTIYQRLHNDPAKAAALLQQAGVPGIRYLDAGSRAQGEGSHNLVVFSPEVMEIIRRYGLAGLLGGGAAAMARPRDDTQ